MDDQGIRPTAPVLPKEIEEDGNELASQIDKDTAKAFFHPAWIKVEEMFKTTIKDCEEPVDPNLPAEEYKIQAMAQAALKNKLIEVLQRVEDAVSATESIKPGRTTKGGN